MRINPKSRTSEQESEINRLGIPKKYFTGRNIVIGQFGWYFVGDVHLSENNEVVVIENCWHIEEWGAGALAGILHGPASDGKYSAIGRFVAFSETVVGCVPAGDGWASKINAEATAKDLLARKRK